MEKMTVGDVARMLDVCTATVRAWDANGKLTPRGRTLGNKRYYTREQIDEFLQQNPTYKYKRK